MATVSPTSTGSIDSAITDSSIMSVISKPSSQGSNISQISSNPSPKSIKSSVTNHRTKKNDSKESFMLLTIKRKWIHFHGNNDHPIHPITPLTKFKQPVEDLAYSVYVRRSLIGSEYHRLLDQIKESSTKVDSMDESQDRLVLTSSGLFQLFKANETEHFQERAFNQRVFDEWLEEKEMKETLEKERESVEGYGPEFVEKITHYVSSTGREFKIRAKRIKKKGEDDGEGSTELECDKACSCESVQKSVSSDECPDCNGNQ